MPGEPHLRYDELGSRVHPDRAVGSPWYEWRLQRMPDVDEAVRLVQLAIAGRKR